MQIAEQIHRAEDLRRKNPGLSLSRSLELALTLPLPAPPEELEGITAADPDDGVDAFVYIPDLQFVTAPEHRHALRLALNSTPELAEAIRAALEPVLLEHLGPVFRAEIANPSAPAFVRIPRALLTDQVAENELKLRECWAARADLQEEFPDVETFVAYANAANRGDARILKAEGVYTHAD